MGKEFLINMSKDEANNYKHSFQFNNIRNNYNLIKFIKDDFNFKQFYENDRGIQNPDKMTFTLEFQRREDKTVMTKIPLKEIRFDEYEPIKNFYFDGLYGEENYVSNRMVDIYAPLSNVIVVGDYIEIIDTHRDNNNEQDYYTLFKGYCTNIKYKNFNTKINFDIELEDITYKGFDTVFEKTIFLKDQYIYNKNDLNNSLLFILCKNMFKLSDSEILSKINIPDIKYPNGAYRKILFTQWNKDDMMYKHFAQIVDSFGGKCYMEDNILTVKNPLGILYSDSYTDWTVPSINYEYNIDNVLNSIYKYDICDNNKVKVLYDQFEVAPKQKIFQLMGTNGSEKEGDAKVSVEANTILLDNKNYFEVNFISDFVMNIDSNFKTLAHYYTIPEDESSKVEIELIKDVHYEIDYLETGGKIRFGNPLNVKLFIDTFIIYGEPVMKTTGNTFEFTRVEVTSRDERIKTIEKNPYIQNTTDADLLAKWIYFNYCTPITYYEFDSNLCSPLNPNTLIAANHPDMNNIKLLITECTHSSNITKIKAIKFDKFDMTTFVGGENNNKNNVDYNILKGLDFIKEDVITVDPTAPAKPANLKLTAMFSNIGVSWDLIPNRQDIKGYFIKIKYNWNGIISESVFFTSSNSYIVPATALKNNDGSKVEYIISVKGVNLKGVEGSYCDEQSVYPLVTLGSDKIEFPTGQDPNDLKDRLDNINFDDLSGTIGANQITGNVITGKLIEADKITSINIAAEAIVASHIKAGTITGNEIAADTISGNNILSNTITSSNINVDDLIANKLTANIIQTDDKAFSVQNGKLTAKSLYGSNFALGEKVLNNNTDNGLLLTGTGFNLMANTTTGDFNLVTSGNTDINNNNNRIYMDKDGLHSQILLGVDWKDTNGNIKPEFIDVDFQVGEETNGGYLKYSNEEGLSMNVVNLEIDGNSILNTVKDISTFGLNGVFNGSNKAGKNFFGQDLFNDGWYITSTLNGDSKPNFNVMLNLYNVAPSYNIVEFTCNESLNKIYTLCFPASARTSYRIYTSPYAQDVTATLEYSSPTYSNNISLGNIKMIHVSPTSEGSNSGLFYNLVIFGSTADDVVNELHRFNGSTDVVLQRTVGSNSLNTINQLLFNIGNRIYYKRLGKLYYTLNNFSTEVLVTNTVYNNYFLLRGIIYAYNFTPVNKLDKLGADGSVVDSYLVPNSLVGTADIRDFGANSNYFYILGLDSFHITRDFKKYTQVFKGNSEDYICVLNKTYILKRRTDSTKADIYMMIGFTFGTLAY